MATANFMRISGLSTLSDLVLGSPARRHGKDRELTGFRTYTYPDSGGVAVHYWTTIFPPELARADLSRRSAEPPQETKSEEDSAKTKDRDFLLHVFFSVSITRHLTLAPSQLTTFI